LADRTESGFELLEKKLRLPKLYSCSKLDEIFYKNLEIVK